MPADDDPFPKGMLEDIKRVLAGHADKRFGCDVYDDVFDSPLMFPLQRRSELAWMMQRAREVSPTTVMEIGADKGGGLYHWIKSLPTVRNVIACEIRGTPYADAFAEAFPSHRFLWMPHCSRTPDMREAIIKAFGPIDCLFIDGDKSAFEQDFNHYKPVLSSKAVVFMHDIQDEAPLRAFTSVTQNRFYYTSRFVNKEDTNVSLDRQRDGIPPSSAYEGWLRYWKGKSCGVGMIKSNDGMW